MACTLDKNPQRLDTNSPVFSLGQPTETEVNQTKKGESGKWGFVVTKQPKHYRTVSALRTGYIFRQLPHITTEEKSRIIPAPVIFHW